MSDANPKASLAPLDRPVFYTSAALLIVLVGTAALFPSAADNVFSELQSWIVANASWYYVLVVAAILLSVVVFALSSYGDIKLGPDHSEPEYSYTSWFAMLFAAGMGIGLMFFGVAEPVMHFLDPPQGEGGTVAAAQEAMKLTFFHWGLHAWAIYAMVGMILAYFAYRHDLPLTLRSALYPLIGERIYGPIGTAVDVFAIIGTAFGVATSMGFGVQQINSGLNYLFGVPSNAWVQVILILFTTGLATISVLLGLDRGIKRLSEINIVLAIVLAGTVLAVGPTVLLLQVFMENTGIYLGDLVSKTFNLYAYAPTDWLGGWTILYWGWWISWAPFVGLFIARISRGRTIREFVFGAMFGPAVFTLFWMTVFGNSAIELILHQDATALAEAVNQDETVALFRFLEYMPFTELLAGLAILMVLVFFITSADSGALVLNMLSSNGNDNTPVARRIFWMAVIGSAALVLLLVGGLSALQTAAIASALPFSLALLAAIWGFRLALAKDHAKRQAMIAATLTPAVSGVSSSWQRRLANMVCYPDVSTVDRFLGHVALPAMASFSQELQANGIESAVHDLRRERQALRLEVFHGNELDFVYEVVNTPHPMPNDALRGKSLEDLNEAEKYFRAEVHFREGGQDYDIMGWTGEQIISDLLEQYEKHLHFLHVLR